MALALTALIALINAAPSSAQIAFATSLDATLVPKTAPVTYAPGDTIFIQVHNGPQDTIPFDNEITATIATSRGDTETVSLKETSQDGVYAGQIQTTFGPSPPVANDGVLAIRGSDTITVTSQAFPAITATVVTNGNVKILEVRENPDSTNIPGQPLPEQAPELKLVTVGQSLLIRVIDDDQNKDPNLAETVQAVVTSAAGDAETVTLTETQPDSGIFEAIVPTDFEATPVAGDGVLSILAGTDGIIATYNDPSTTNGVQPTPATADVRAGADGTFTVSPATLNPGAELRVNITDTDQTADAHSGPGNDTVTVTATSVDAGGNTIDRETFVIKEDNLTEALFTRALPYAFVAAGVQGSPNDGTLQVTNGGNITLTYNDALRASGQTNVPVPAATNPVQVQLSNTAPTLTFVQNLNCDGNVPRIVPGDVVYLCVHDANASLGNGTNSVTVTLVTNRDNTGAVNGPSDTEVVLLSETGVHTGIFTGSIDTRFADAVANVVIPNNGTLDVRGRDQMNTGLAAPQIRASYQPANPAQALLTATQAVNVDGSATFTRDGSGTKQKRVQFRAGDPLFVEVDDDDLNRDPNVADTLTVTLTSFSGGPAPVAGPIIFATAPNAVDQEVVTLKETGVNTGVFVIDNTGAPFNGFPTTFLAAGQGTVNNGVLEVRASANIPGSQTNAANTVVVEYSDPETSTGNPAFPRDTVFVRKGADGQISVTDQATGGAAIGGDTLQVKITGDFISQVGGVAPVDPGIDPSFVAGPGNETRSVTVTSFSGPNGTGTLVDSEQIVISEDNVVEGTFIGLVPSRYRTSAGVPPASPPANDGTLEVVQGGSIVAAFTEFITVAGQPNRLSTSLETPPYPPLAPGPVRNALAVAGAIAGTVRVVNSLDPISTAAATATLRRIAPGGTVFIRVDDQDLRVVQNGLTNGVTVTALSVFQDPNTGNDVIEDTEIVQLQTTTQPGVLMGSIQTQFGDTVNGLDARPGDGVLQVRGRSRIRVQYIDAAPFGIRDSQFGVDNTPNTADDQPDTQVNMIGLARFLTNGGRTEVQGTGTIRQMSRAQALQVFQSFPPSSLSLRAGNPTFVAVVDDDANLSPNNVDQLGVRIVTSAGDTENVTLTETGTDTGVFVLDNLDGIRTQLVTASPTANDGILQVVQNGSITLDYTDTTLPSPATGTVGDITVVSDGQDVQPGVDAILTTVDQADNNPNTVKAGDNILITVTYPAATQQFDPNKLNTVNVSISSGGAPPNGDSEAVTLYETDLDSRVFRGFIPTRFSQVGTPGNGTLEIADSDPTRRQITVTYIDSQPATPGVKNGAAAIVQNTSNILVINSQLVTRTGANGQITLIGTQSQSADEFILGDTIRVSVSDPNLGGLAIGTVNVSVSAPSGDLENITLSQIGTTGDFNNDATRLPTTYDQSIVRGDGVLEAVGGATSNALKGEPITFTYTVGVDASGRMLSAVSSTMRAFTRGTIRFAIDKTQGGQVANPTPANPPQPNLPAPQPRFGQENDLFVKDDTLVAFQGGDRLFIRVIDSDMDFPSSNPQVPNTLRVTLTSVNLANGVSGDSEVVVCTEQPRVNGETVKGTFIGSIPTVYANPPNTLGTPNNGTLEMIGHDLVTATYVDINTNEGNTNLVASVTTSTEARANGSISIVDSANGITVTPIISLMPMPGNQTAMLFIRVVDKDFDTDNKPGTDAGPQVTITTDRGDTETIATTESTITPGEFRGQIPIVFGRLVVPGDGRLEVVGGDLVTACYTDQFNTIPGQSTVRCATAHVEKRNGALLEVFVPRTGIYQQPNRLEELIIGEPLKIRVTDLDADLTAAPDAVTVTIKTNNPTKPDQETLVLTETGNSTGVFEGQIPTAFPDIVNAPPNSAARFNNGILTVVGGDLITITYIELQDPTGQKNVPLVATLTAARNYTTTQEVSNTAKDNSTILLPNGAKLTIPPGALHLNETVTFTLKYATQFIDEFGKVVPGPLNPAIQLAGDSGQVGFYQVLPTDLVFKKLVEFDIPVPSTITVQGSNTMLSDADRQRLKLFYFDGFDWEPSAGLFFRDATGREFIQAFSNHLTLFALALDNRPPPPLAGSLLTRLSLDKNPFTPNGDGINDTVQVQFGLGAAATVTVKVLDVSGDLVRTLLDHGAMQAGYNTLMWDGTYAFSTRTVPVGMYVIVVKAEGGGATDTQSIGVGVMK